MNTSESQVFQLHLDTIKPLEDKQLIEASLENEKQVRDNLEAQSHALG